jgi:transposase InsO family protein
VVRGELASGPDVSDCTAQSRLKLLTVVDTFTRESLAIEVDTSISGERVARVLDRVIGERGAQPDESSWTTGRS